MKLNNAGPQCLSRNIATVSTVNGGRAVNVPKRLVKGRRCNFGSISFRKSINSVRGTLTVLMTNVARGKLVEIDALSDSELKQGICDFACDDKQRHLHYAYRAED